MIEAHELTKRYGHKIAVDHVSFTISPGSVTGFLGPNGAGKSAVGQAVAAVADGEELAQLLHRPGGAHEAGLGS